MYVPTVYHYGLVLNAFNMLFASIFHDEFTFTFLKSPERSQTVCSKLHFHKQGPVVNRIWLSNLLFVAMTSQVKLRVLNLLLYTLSATVLLSLEYPERPERSAQAILNEGQTHKKLRVFHWGIRYHPDGFREFYHKI